MSPSVSVVYYCDNLADHQLILQELSNTLISRRHAVTLVTQDAAYRHQLRTCLRVTVRERVRNLDARQSLAFIDKEAAWLRSVDADVVVSAAVPFGCAAAAAAGVCAVCIAHTTGGNIRLCRPPYGFCHPNAYVPFSKSFLLVSYPREYLTPSKPTLLCDASVGVTLHLDQLFIHLVQVALLPDMPCLLQRQSLQLCAEVMWTKAVLGTAALATLWPPCFCDCLGMLPC